MEAQHQANSMAEFLNEYIYEFLHEEAQDDDEQIALQQDAEKLADIDFENNVLGYQYLAERIDNVSELLIDLLFDSITNDVEKLSKYLLRGVGNDLWNFMYFMLTCLERLDIRKGSYEQVQRALEIYCQKMLLKEKERFTSFFKELFLTKFIDAVKSAESYEKREILIRLLYCFVPDTPQAKHEALRLYKAKLNDMQIFIQSLAVLIDMETELSKENDDLIKDFKIYAKLAIKEKRATIRLNGLLLMNKLIMVDSDWVQRVMIRYFDCVSSSDYWENRIMIVAVYSNLLAKLKQSELYRQHIKPNNTDMAKVISVENEMLIRVMKEMIDKITSVLAKVLEKNLSPVLTRVSMIYIAEVMEDNRNLANIFLDLLIDAGDETRDWVLGNPSDEEQEGIREKFYIKTRTSLCYPCQLNRDNLKKAANELLTEMASKLKTIDSPSFESAISGRRPIFSRSYLDVLVYCFENADFQRLNVEVTDNFINNSIDHVILGMKIPDLAEGCSQLLQHYIDSVIREEVIIPEFEKRLSEMIVSTLNGENIPETYQESAKENIKSFIVDLCARNTPDKAVYERFVKLGSKIHSLANRKSLADPEDAEFIEQHFGLSEEGQIEMEDA
jgi:hypothetical protein